MNFNFVAPPEVKRAASSLLDMYDKDLASGVCELCKGKKLGTQVGTLAAVIAAILINFHDGKKAHEDRLALTIAALMAIIATGSTLGVKERRSSNHSS